MSKRTPKEWLAGWIGFVRRVRLSASRERSVVVLIDADGISHRAADAIMRFASDLGPVAQVNVYGNFSGRLAGQWAAPVRRYRARAHMCFSTVAGKNASDIRLTVDAVDSLHQRKRQTFVLCSSDSDLAALAGRIRESGSLVYGIGATHTPHSFRDACTSFMSVQLLLDRAAARGADNAYARKLTHPPTHVQDLVISTVFRLGGDAEWVPMTVLGPALRERDPTFHARSFKRRTLVDLVSSVEMLEVDERASPACVRLISGGRNGSLLGREHVKS